MDFKEIQAKVEDFKGFTNELSKIYGKGEFKNQFSSEELWEMCLLFSSVETRSHYLADWSEEECGKWD